MSNSRLAFENPLKAFSPAVEEKTNHEAPLKPSGLEPISAFAWALLFWLTGLEPTFDKAVFLALTTISALGGDQSGITSPWRVLLPLASINGALLFGLSTALMFRLVNVFHFRDAIQQEHVP